MDRTERVDELVTFAKSAGEDGTVWMHQGNYVPEEPILSDEDTAGREPLQVLQVLIEAGGEMKYAEFLFYSAAELEELTIELQPVYDRFEKEVISADAMKEKTRNHKE